MPRLDDGQIRRVFIVPRPAYFFYTDYFFLFDDFANEGQNRRRRRHSCALVIFFFFCLIRQKGRTREGQLYERRSLKNDCTLQTVYVRQSTTIEVLYIILFITYTGGGGVRSDETMRVFRRAMAGVMHWRTKTSKNTPPTIGENWATKRNFQTKFFGNRLFILRLWNIQTHMQINKLDAQIKSYYH